MTIDINCDCGEDPAFVVDGRQERLLSFVTRGSVACGGHAGDDDTMRATVQQCAKLGVIVGAHPSYPDRSGFGRRRVDVHDLHNLSSSLRAQLNALRAIAQDVGVRVDYVKPHGQLYHDVESMPDVSLALLAAVHDVVGDVPIMVRARSPAIARFPSTIAEAFADRAYEPDGRLRPRTEPGALLDVDAAVTQARRIAREGWAQSICIHSDSPDALAIAREIAGT
jgi:UPF0271 protein